MMPASGIQEALRSESIRKSSDRDLNNTLVAVYARAAMITGQTPDEKEVQFLVSSLQEILRRDFPSLRIDELAIAVERGVTGHYGEYYGVNVASFVKFIKAYLQSEERKSSVLKSLPPAPEKAPPTPEQLMEMENEVISNAYKTFCQTGNYEDYGSHVYGKLDERGLITFTPEVKKSMMEEARRAVTARNNPSAALSHQEHRKMSDFIKDLTDGRKQASEVVVKEAKKIALTRYFSDLKEMNLDINELL